MKKYLGIIAGFIVAAAAMVVVSGTGTPVAAESCTNGAKYTDFTGSYSGRDTMTVSTKDNKKLCKDVTVNFASFTIRNTYNGKGFKNNPTALPQSQFYNKTVTLKKGTNGKTTVKVEVPNACTDYQIDAYIGPVQTEITTNEGFIGTNAIVSALFQRTKTDCSVKVKVCNPANGEIITVDEKEASKYKPVGDVACTSFPVCDFASKSVKTIKGYQFDSTKMSKNVNAAECQPEPNKVRVCNPANGQIIEVKESDASKYKPVGDEACEDLDVCVLDTGKTGTIKGYQYDSSKYSKDVNDAACTPGKGGETPEVIAETGPVEVVSAFLGTGSLAGAATAYVRSRRALRG